MCYRVHNQYCMYLDEWLCGVWLVDSNVLGPLPLNSQSSLPHLHWMLGLLKLSKLVNAQLKKYNIQQSQLIPYGRKFSRDPISQKVHLQRFRDLIFADGRSRIAPPTISVRLHLLLHARHGSNLVGTGRQAIDRSYLYLAEIEKWHKSSI